MQQKIMRTDEASSQAEHPAPFSYQLENNKEYFSSRKADGDVHSHDNNNKHTGIAESLNIRSLPTSTPVIRRTLVDVEQDLQAMDALLGTNFYHWLKSEKNLRKIIPYLQKFVASEEYSVDALGNGISWIITGWTLRTTTELFLRVFCMWGVGYPKTARIINRSTKIFKSDRARMELYSAMVAYESAANAAAFIRYLTECWCEENLLYAISYVSTKLAWTEDYYKEFLFQFMHITEKNYDLSSDVQRTIIKVRMLFVEEHLSHRESIIQAYKIKRKSNNDFIGKAADNTGRSDAGPQVDANEYIKMIKFFSFLLKKYVNETQSIISHAVADIYA